jgi:antitoxin component YwqK of YwqJK toxin-antitoxin module
VSCEEEQKQVLNDGQIYCYANGNIKQTGNWKDGIQDGEWVYYVDGKILGQLTYSNGEIIGKKIKAIKNKILAHEKLHS